MKQRFKRCVAILMALMICFTTVIPSNLTAYAAGNDAVNAVPYTGADDDDDEAVVTTEASKQQETVDAATTEAAMEEEDENRSSQTSSTETVSVQEEADLDAGDISEEYIDYDSYFGSYTKLTRDTDDNYISGRFADNGKLLDTWMENNYLDYRRGFKSNKNVSQLLSGTWDYLQAPVTFYSNMQDEAESLKQTNTVNAAKDALKDNGSGYYCSNSNCWLKSDKNTTKQKNYACVFLKGQSGTTNLSSENIGYTYYNAKVPNADNTKWEKVDIVVQFTSIHSNPNRSSNVSGSYLWFRTDVPVPAVILYGADQIKFTISVYYAGTTTPYSLKTNFSYYDIDALQYVGLGKSNTTLVTNRKADGNTNLYGIEKGGYLMATSDDEASDTYDKANFSGWITEGSSFNFTLGTRGNSDGGKSASGSQYSSSWAFFGSACQYIKTPSYTYELVDLNPTLENPTKDIIAYDETTSWDGTCLRAGSIYYTITQDIPAGYKKGSITSYVLTDKIPDYLQVINTTPTTAGGIYYTIGARAIYEPEKTYGQSTEMSVSYDTGTNVLTLDIGVDPGTVQPVQMGHRRPADTKLYRE